VSAPVTLGEILDAIGAATDPAGTRDTVEGMPFVWSRAAHDPALPRASLDAIAEAALGDEEGAAFDVAGRLDSAVTALPVHLVADARVGLLSLRLEGLWLARPANGPAPPRLGLAVSIALSTPPLGPFAVNRVRLHIGSPSP